MEKKAKLLIVDDEDIVLKSCQRILKDEPYTIETATSGSEALAKADADRYDVIITDLMMPGISGMEVLKNVLKKRPDQMVIIFTGYATVESVRGALKLGAFDYIPKPFTSEEFKGVISNALKAIADSANTKMLDLMSIVSHELKSPLSTVFTTAETLYRGYFGTLSPEQEKKMESILRNCQYLEDIIRNYIDLSKMDIDNLASFSEEIDIIDDVIMPICAIPEHENNFRHMRIETSFGALPKINGDKNLLRIVMTNLINNAIKYGKDNTVIRVAAVREADRVQVSVYNEGVGISGEDIQNRLFRKFNRLKQKGTEGVKGSGLGLYICREIIEKHGGCIRVESEEGKWVKFLVGIPVGHKN